jgi:hypothetical protein
MTLTKICIIDYWMTLIIICNMRNTIKLRIQNYNSFLIIILSDWRKLEKILNYFLLVIE